MFGKNLRYYRLRNSMTQKKLAEKSDLTALAITNYENRDRMPSTVQRLVSHSPEAFSRSMVDVIELYAPITRHFSYRVFKFPFSKFPSMN